MRNLGNLGKHIYRKETYLPTEIERAKGGGSYASAVSKWGGVLKTKPSETMSKQGGTLGGTGGTPIHKDFYNLRVAPASKSNEVKGEAGTYGQTIWGDAKAPAQVEGLGIGEDMEYGDTDTGRRKRRGTKTSAGLGI